MERKRLNGVVMGVVSGFIAVLLVCGTVFAQGWSTVVFREDFDVPASGMPDANTWVCNNPDSWWWVLGRTFFPSPVYHPSAIFPQVNNGVCVIEHHNYNAWHLGTPKTTFLGGELHTVRLFEPDTSYRFEARVRCNPYPNGLVTSFFLYGYDGSNSDEVDFEFVSNKTNDDVNYPDGDPVLTNPWNESHQCPLYVAPNGLDLTEWNTFRLYWYPDQNCMEWTLVDPCNGEKLLRRETNPNCVPDESMALYFNFWAPNAAWQDAYSANLQPVSYPNANQIYEYEIDYVEARVAGPVEFIAELIQEVAGLELPSGIENSLDAKLDAALKALEDINENNNVAAINTLQAFVNAIEAQRGNRIPEADSDDLIAAAQEIIDLLSAE